MDERAPGRDKGSVAALADSLGNLNLSSATCERSCGLLCGTWRAMFDRPVLCVRPLVHVGSHWMLGRHGVCAVSQLAIIFFALLLHLWDEIAFSLLSETVGGLT